jgi:amino-acid N-acetyltransferase
MAEAMQIRRASAADQATIDSMVRTAKLNPFNVHWQNFQVAEEAGRIIGVGQLRPHKGGSLELASLAVVPEQQHRGAGSRLTRALLADRRPPIYLFCEQELAEFYDRFGFHLVAAKALPGPLARLFFAGRLVKRLDKLLGRGNTQLIGMRWG